jgi:hypothetical protein
MVAKFGCKDSSVNNQLIDRKNHEIEALKPLGTFLNAYIMEQCRFFNT